MKNWHWGLILAFVVAYLIGVKFPSIGQKLFAKIGM